MSVLSTLALVVAGATVLPTWPASAVPAPFEMTIEIPASSNVTYFELGLWNLNGTVTWGDGTAPEEVLRQSTLGIATHDYPAAAQATQYTISVGDPTVGSLTASGLRETATPQYLVAVNSWGSLASNTSFVSLEGAFKGATNFVDVPISEPAFVSSVAQTFMGATSFDDADISNWSSSRFTNAESMFEGATSFNRQLTWSAPVLATTQRMFFGATQMNSSVSITSPVLINTGSMFNGATAFNKPVNIDTSHVVNMAAMFWGASSFNRPLTLNMSSVSWAIGMLRDTGMSVSNWSTTLMNWAAQAPNLNGGLNLSTVSDAVQRIPHDSTAVAAFDLLTSQYGWNILDGGQIADPMTLMLQIPQSVPASFELPVQHFTGMVDWGDGSIERLTNSTNPTHTYPTAGSPIVKVYGTAEGYGKPSGPADGADLITSVIGWGELGSSATAGFSLENAFAGATNLQQIPGDPPAENITSMAGMFAGASSIDPDLSSWPIDSLDDATDIFVNSGLSALNYSYLLRAWGDSVDQWSSPSGIDLGYVGVPYYSWAADGHAALIANSWTVIDQGAVQFNPSGLAKLTVTAPSANTFTYVLPVQGFTGFIDWGDGLDELVTTATSNISHTFTPSSSGERFDIELSDDAQAPLNATGFGSGANPLAGASTLTDVVSWGPLEFDADFTSLSGAFNGATNLEVIPQRLPLYVTDLSYAFHGAATFNASLRTWVTRNVTDMSHMFDGATAFDQDLSYWNTSNVTDMSFAFAAAAAFNHSLQWWNLSSATSTEGMFQGATAFESDLSDWDVADVSNMSYMFDGAAAFDSDLSGWNVSQVTDMSYMFRDAVTFGDSDGDVTGWNTVRVSDMSHMFENASSFWGGVETFDPSALTDATDMLTNTDIDDWTWSYLLDNWATYSNLHSNVTLGVSPATYWPSVQDERDFLTDPNGLNWTIYDAGLGTEPPPPCATSVQEIQAQLDAQNTNICLDAWNTGGTMSGDHLTIPTDGLLYTLDLSGYTLDLNTTTTQGGAAIDVSAGAQLEIKDSSWMQTGQLHATADSWSGAAIGGGAGRATGSITISSGTVVATAYGSGAGIGGGSSNGSQHNSAGVITITGGSVTAQGGLYSAGIGSSNFSLGGTVTITGGSVTATGGPEGAGIGNGQNWNGFGRLSSVSITGGTVTAQGGNDLFMQKGPGAGIGGGGSNTAGHITIDGAASIEAIGGTRGSTIQAPAIGAGAYGRGGSVTIRGGAQVNLQTGSGGIGDSSAATTGVPGDIYIGASSIASDGFTAIFEPATLPVQNQSFRHWSVTGTNPALTVPGSATAQLPSGTVSIAASYASLVTFDAGGALHGTTPASVFYDGSTQVTDPGQGNLDRIGYTFDGWADDQGNLVDFTTFAPSQDTTLFARWTALTSGCATVNYWADLQNWAAPAGLSYCLSGTFLDTQSGGLTVPDGLISALDLNGHNLTISVSGSDSAISLGDYSGLYISDSASVNGVGATLTLVGGSAGASALGERSPNTENAIILVGGVTLDASTGWAAQAISDVQVIVGSSQVLAPGTTVTMFSADFGSDGWSVTGESDYFLPNENFTLPAGQTQAVAVTPVIGDIVRYFANVPAGNQTTVPVPSDRLYPSGTSITTDVAPTLGGYTFSNWDIWAVGGSGTSFTAGQTVTLSGDLDLWAQWSANQYSISYVYGSGTAATGPGSAGDSTYSTGQNFNLPDDPTSTIKTFAGWSITGDTGNANAGTGSISGRTGAVTGWGNLVVTALWTGPNEIRYDDNTTDTVTGAVPATVGFQGPGSYTVEGNPNSLARAGYTLLGWSTSSGATTPQTTITPAGDEVLYAVWEPIQWAVSYDFGGGSIPSGSSNSGDLSYATGSGFALPDRPEKTGFAFDKWVFTATGSPSTIGTASIANGVATLSGYGDVLATATWRSGCDVVVHNMTELTAIDLTSGPVVICLGASLSGTRFQIPVGGDVTLDLQEFSLTLSPTSQYGVGGLRVPDGASLTVRTSSSQGSLTAGGGPYAAGIGGGVSGEGAGSITIESGTVSATGQGAAGIGGSGNGSGGQVEIAGGVVSASSNAGAGIGSGRGGYGGSVLISGGSVTAVSSGSGGAGIGGGGLSTPIFGQQGSVGSAAQVTITGGTVHAIGSNLGSGIGGGNGQPGAGVTISGGDVTAIGSNLASGIGGGNGQPGAGITISGGDVTAVGSVGGAGIGGGYYGDGGSISISGGTVHATGGPYTSHGGAGIGAGDGASGGTIEISAGTVTATGAPGAAAIGGSFIGDSGDITLTGGTVTAMSDPSVASPAIGAGPWGTVRSIVIGAATILATGGGFRQGWGNIPAIGGLWGSQNVNGQNVAGQIAISDGATINIGIAPASIGTTYGSPDFTLGEATINSTGFTAMMLSPGVQGNLTFSNWAVAHTANSVTSNTTVAGGQSYAVPAGLTQVTSNLVPAVGFNDFGAYHGTAPATQLYLGPSSLIDPGQGTLDRIGSTFAGWEDAQGNLIDFATFQPTQNVNLFPRWQAITSGCAIANYWADLQDWSAGINASYCIPASFLDSQTGSLSVGPGAHPTIDLAGHALTITSNSAAGAIELYDGAVLDVIDSVGGGTLTLEDGLAGSALSTTGVLQNGVLRVNGVQLVASSGSLNADVQMGAGSILAPGATFEFTSVPAGFDGWSISGSTSVFGAAAVYTLPDPQTTALTIAPTIGAQLTYHANVPSGSPAIVVPTVPVKAAGSSVTVAGVLARDGYNFVGWFDTSASSGGTGYSSGSAFTLNADVDLYARWSADTTNPITVDLAGGTAAVAGDSVYTTDAAFDLPSGVSRGGYTLTGWTISGTNVTGQTLSRLASSATMVGYGAITVTATWTPVTTNSVTYYFNGGTPRGYAGDTVYTSDGTINLPVDVHKDGYTFSGWNLTGGASTSGAITAQTTSIQVTGYGNVFFWPIYSALTNNPITIDLAGGVSGGSGGDSQYPSDGTVNLPPAPSKSGFVFAGWQLTGPHITSSSTSRVDTSAIVSGWGALTLTAIWQPGITWNAQGGSVLQAGSASYAPGGAAVLLPTINRAGYTFLGWFDAAAGGSELLPGTTLSSTGARTFYAHWQAQTFPVTYDSQGGTAVANGSYTTDQAFTLAAAPTQSGLVFRGWFESQSGGSALASPYLPTIPYDVSLFAQWGLELNWGAAGGTITVPGSDNFVTGTTIESFPAIHRVGYSFDGWFTAQSGGTAVIATTQMTATGATTLWAHWTARTDNAISYALDGGTAGTPSHVSTYTTDAQFALDGDPIKTNYTFMGWNLTGSNAQTVFITQGMSNTIVNGWGAVTLTAIWQPNISWDPNGGSIAQNAQGSAHYQPNGTAIVLPSVSRSGYTLTGWFTAQTGGSQVLAGATLTTTTPQTFHARWSADAHVVSYDSHGGSAVSPGSFDSDGSTVLASAPSRTGYTFRGWFVAANGGSALSSPYSPGVYTGITLHAQWAPNLTWNPNGGVITVPGSANFVTGLQIATFPGVSRGGYTFTGWFTAQTGGSVVDASVFMSQTTPTTIWARWTANTNNAVTVDLAGGTAATPGASSYTTDASFNLPTGVERGGYTLSGWSISGTYVNSQSLAASASSAAPVGYGPVTVTAQWSASTTNPITLNFNGGTSSQSMGANVYTTAAAFALPSVPVRGGYLFSGWTITGSMITATSAGVGATSVSVAGWGAITLTAGWTARTDNPVSINLAGGTAGAAGASSYTTGASMLLPGNPARTGYTFAGWTLTGTDAVTQNLPDTATTATVVGWGAVTLTASWVARTYQLIYDTHGGSPIPNGSFQTDGNTALASAPSRVGYTFLGWFAAQTGGRVLRSPYAPGVTSDVTLHAHWSDDANPSVFVIDFRGNGGTGLAPLPGNFTVGGARVVAPANTFTRAGFVFAGWNDEADGSGTGFAVGAPISTVNDLELFAQWTPEPPTVSSASDSSATTASVGSASAAPTPAVTPSATPSATATATPTVSASAEVAPEAAQSGGSGEGGNAVLTILAVLGGLVVLGGAAAAGVSFIRGRRL